MKKRVKVIVEGREYIVEVGDLNESPIKATVNDRTYHVEVPKQDGPSQDDQAAGEGEDAPAPEPTPLNKAAAPSAIAADNAAITAPMPGNIVEVKVKAGDSVNPGDVVCVLEAMKMNNLIHSSVAGVVASVGVTAGQAVDYGAVLVTFE